MSDNNISASTVQEDTSNLYIVTVEIDSEDLQDGIDLKSGLSGTMEIKVGKRNILNYFLEPIIGNISNSLKEH